MNPAAAAATKREQRHKKPRAGREIAMAFIVHNADAIATLLAGIWATHVAWCRERIAAPHALGRPERWIGPLLVAFALLKLAVAP
jgi:hypothetical protein